MEASVACKTVAQQSSRPQRTAPQTGCPTRLALRPLGSVLSRKMTRLNVVSVTLVKRVENEVGWEARLR